MSEESVWTVPEAVAAAQQEVPALALPSTMLPSLVFPSKGVAPSTPPSTAGALDLRAFCAERAVLYLYPATGVPGRDPAIDPAPGWDDIPGAAGCTPQSLGFQQEHEAFAQLGVRVAGISAQPLAEMRDFAARHALPFPLLCDERLELQRAWALPTFQVGARTFLKRMVLYVEGNRVQLALFPVPEPRGSARAMLQLLASRGSPLR